MSIIKKRNIYRTKYKVFAHLHVSNINAEANNYVNKFVVDFISCLVTKIFVSNICTNNKKTPVHTRIKYIAVTRYMR